MKVIIALIVAAVLAVPGPGFAQDEAAVAKARELNEEGTALFEGGQFEEAARKFRAAYDAVPDPFLLGSESVAWFEAGDCARALSVADEFSATLAEDESMPKPLLKVRAGCVIREAEAAIGDEDFAAAESALDRASEMEGVTEKQSDRIAELRSRVDDERSVAAPAPSEPPPTDGGGSVRPIVGWSLIALGATAGALSIASAVAFTNEKSDYETFVESAPYNCRTEGSSSTYDCDQVPTDQELDDEGIEYVPDHGNLIRRRTLAYALGSGGAVLAAVGAVVLLTGASEGDARVLVTPTGVSFRLTF